LKKFEERAMAVHIEELRKLPITDKLRIVEQLWDDIGASDEDFPLPTWHKEEAQRRVAELDANPDLALTREQLWRSVDQADG
jgi:putative addiction module component (TIGR02574 family)